MMRCQPQCCGETEGAPWLGSTQLCKVFRLQLHHHVVEPANDHDDDEEDKIDEDEDDDEVVMMTRR